MSFAGALKDAVSVIFGWERDLLEGSTLASRQWREQVDKWWAQRLGIPNLTPRWVLQYWGTEICRNNFHKDIWVASLEAKIRKTTDNVVITDCRFANEVAAIKNANGISIRVERGVLPEWYKDAFQFQKGTHNIGWAMARERLERAGIHASEYSSVGLNYDYTIFNDGSIDDLHQQVTSIVNQ